MRRLYYWIRMMYFKSLMDTAIKNDEVLDYYNKYIKAKAKFLKRKKHR